MKQALNRLLATNQKQFWSGQVGVRLIITKEELIRRKRVTFVLPFGVFALVKIEERLAKDCVWESTFSGQVGQLG